MADANTAVRKLQSGQPLTDEEKKILGISVTSSTSRNATTPAAKAAADRVAAIPVAGVVNTPAPVATPQQQAALVAQVVAAAVIASPVVADTPKNVAPNRTEAEIVARQIAAVVAPAIAPSLPPASVAVVVKETVKAIVTNPEVKASDVGQTVNANVATTVAEKVSVSTPVVNSIAASIPVAGVVNTPRPAPAPTELAPFERSLGGYGGPGIPTPTPAAQPTPSATVDSRSALNKLTSGQALTADEQAILNIAPRPAAQPTPSATVDSRVALNKLTSGQELTPEERQALNLSPTGATGVTGPTGTGPVEAKVYTASDGTEFTDQAAFVKYQEILSSQNADKASAAAQLRIDEENKRLERQSAYDLLFQQFQQYGLGGLVEPLKGLIISGSSPSEFTIKLRESDAYKDRFAANKERINKGLSALSEAEYIGLEDQYQNIMRQYGLPSSYYEETTSSSGIKKQAGFEKFLEGDISPTELEDRLITAQKRVLNANPEVTQALKQFYPDITNADILAYTLDPKNAIENIKRKVTTAEIGGAALQVGLQTGVNRADVLRAAGVTKESAQQGFGTIAGGLQRGSQLASIYGEDPYTQEVAETEVFNIAGAKEARKQRQKITGLEKATFGGQTGITSGALARDRAGGY